MSLDATRANQILEAIHATTVLPASTAPTRVRLMTVNGSASTPGTEVAAGGGYTAGATAPSVGWAAAAGQSQATNAAVNVTNYPRVETVVGIEVWDSNAAPKRQEFGALSAPKTMAAGDTLSFAAGAITSALS